MYNSDQNEQAHWEDLSFLQEEKWLQRSAVSLRVMPRSGRYWVVLTYADSNQPFRLRIRYIADYSTAAKAQQAGEIFLRAVRRDPRGTFKININDFDLRHN